MLEKDQVTSDGFVAGMKAALEAAGLPCEMFSDAQFRSIATIIAGAQEGITPQVREALKELSPELRPLIIQKLSEVQRNIVSVLLALEAETSNN